MKIPDRAVTYVISPWNAMQKTHAITVDCLLSVVKCRLDNIQTYNIIVCSCGTNHKDTGTSARKAEKRYSRRRRRRFALWKTIWFQIRSEWDLGRTIRTSVRLNRIVRYVYVYMSRVSPGADRCCTNAINCLRVFAEFRNDDVFENIAQRVRLK